MGEGGSVLTGLKGSRDARFPPIPGNGIDAGCILSDVVG
jgi:hypothetical protein